MADALTALSGLYQATGRYDKAEQLLRRSLEINEAMLGKDHPDVADNLASLAGLYARSGQWDKVTAASNDLADTLFYLEDA